MERVIGLNKDVADRLATHSVRNVVVDQLVAQEIERRKVAVLALIDKASAKSKELRKLQAQGNVVFTSKGDAVGEATFTKQQLEEIKKTNDEIARIDSALALAFDKGDFNKVFELAK